MVVLGGGTVSYERGTPVAALPPCGQLSLATCTGEDSATRPLIAPGSRNAGLSRFFPRSISSWREAIRALLPLKKGGIPSGFERVQHGFTKCRSVSLPSEHVGYQHVKNLLLT